MWVSPTQTLRQQALLDSSVVLTLRKKLFFTDENVNSNDPVQLHLLFVQVHVHCTCTWYIPYSSNRRCGVYLFEGSVYKSRYVFPDSLCELHYSLHICNYLSPYLVHQCLTIHLRGQATPTIIVSCCVYSRAAFISLECGARATFIQRWRLFEELHYMYVHGLMCVCGPLNTQCREAVIEGTHPVTKQEAIELAALQLQVEFGNQREGHVDKNFVKSM